MRHGRGDDRRDYLDITLEEKMRPAAGRLLEHDRVGEHCESERLVEADRLTWLLTTDDRTAARHVEQAPVYRGESVTRDALGRGAVDTIGQPTWHLDARCRTWAIGAGRVVSQLVPEASAGEVADFTFLELNWRRPGDERHLAVFD